MSRLPYFDLLIEGRRGGDPAALLFDRFVHWGYWDEPARADRTEEGFARAMERLDAQVVGAAQVGPGHVVLDAGCGFGGTLAGLEARRYGSTRLGVNIDGRQLRFAAHAAPASRFARADACRLPVASACLDRALAVECIFHFPSRLAFLKEAARTLKPGGRLGLSDFVPAKLGAGGRLGKLAGGVLERLVARGYGKLGDGWPDGGYAEMAEKAGLELVVDRDITRNTLPTYDVLLDLLRRGAMGGLSGPMGTSTRVLAWLSRLGVVRYRVVGFRKPA